jgi:hypothetical protein
MARRRATRGREEVRAVIAVALSLTGCLPGALDGDSSVDADLDALLDAGASLLDAAPVDVGDATDTDFLADVAIDARIDARDASPNSPDVGCFCPLEGPALRSSRVRHVPLARAPTERLAATA